MKYKTYKCNSFNVYTIKTDKFKTCHLEVIFRNKIKTDDLVNYTMLVDLLTDTTKKYPKRKDLVTRFEELYKLSIYGTTARTGNVLNSIIVSDFINPGFIDSKTYLEDVIKEIFDMIMQPNVVNDEFDLKYFNLVKERMKRDILSLKENPAKESLYGAFNALEGDTPTKYRLMGNIESLEKITPASLYQVYKKLFKENTCDIFVIGDVDTDYLVQLIKKYFNNRYIKCMDTQLDVKNKLRRKEVINTCQSNNIQANLSILYNVSNLTLKERNITFYVFNYIFGNGGLTSKLYKKIREENSLCYGISSYYMKYDGILLIQMALENKSVKKSISYVKKCLNEMQNSKFSDEDVEDAINNIIVSLDLSQDNNNSIMNNYVFKIYDNLPDIEERKELLRNITREEIVAVSKKIKLNNIYVLEGKVNE